MLSIENPPSDPLCPCEISQLKSSDEKASDKLEVDLSKSGLDDDYSNPPPKFSIRDYVFSTRSKDIKTNWPFSQRNLQLCLKHGVRNLLPPFQTLDRVKYPFSERCTVEVDLVDKERSSNLNGDPRKPSGHLYVESIVAGCNQNLDTHCLNINPSGSGDKEITSTTTSQSCSEINSVPTNRSSFLEAEANTVLGSLAAKPKALTPAASNKSESTSQPPVKKSRLVVKLSNLADPSSKDENPANSFMVSEAMASKVCPVCKTFSSSSNTTLNAHIDQCLSGESTIKWPASSKVIKHKIKSRKMKLMVDIYATAPRCTLEDLDRRNGTSWALNLGLPAQEIEPCAEGKKERSFSIDLGKTVDEGAVYIDASGTKLRILSKCDDEKSSYSKAANFPRVEKFLKGGGKRKLLTKKKKFYDAHSYQKLLKNASHGKKVCSPNLRSGSEIRSGQERNFSPKGSSLEKRLRSEEQMKFKEPLRIRQWVCSKRTGLTKKMSGTDDCKPSGCSVTKSLQAENMLSPFVDSCAKSFQMNSPSSNLPSPETKKLDSLSHGPHDCYQDQICPRKRSRSSLTESQICDRKKKSVVSLKHKAKQGKSCPSVHDGYRDLQNAKENPTSSLSKKTWEMNPDPVTTADHSVNTRLNSGHLGFSLKSQKFSSLRNNLLSNSQASVPVSKFSLKRKSSDLTKPRVSCMSESDVKASAEQSGATQQPSWMENKKEKQVRMGKDNDKVPVDKTKIFKIRKTRGDRLINRKEKVWDLKDSQAAAESYGHDVLDRVGSSYVVGSVLAGKTSDVESAGEDVPTPGKEIATLPTPEMAVERALMDLRKSLDPGLDSALNSHNDSQPFVEDEEQYVGPPCSECPPDPDLSEEQGMFCGDEVGKSIFGQSVNIVAELESNDRQGNYSIEVDPIPIPGPPGSFLPSPGDMESEDFQGNSSLTTSLVQSSDDHCEFVGGDSSDSPVSAMSTISNSDMVRSYSRSSEPTGSCGVQDDIRSLVMVNPSVENSLSVQLADHAVVEKLNLDQSKSNVVCLEKVPLRLRTDQPCCCSRKEGALQGATLSYQESHLLRRRAVLSASLPSSEKQVDNDPGQKMDSLNLSSGEFCTANLNPVHEKVPSNFSMGYIQANILTDSEVKVPAHGDCGLSSPSSSNPILRLMGKNLVVNKEGVPPQPNVINDHANPQFNTVSGISSGNAQNEDHSSFHHMVSPGLFISQQNEINMGKQHADVKLRNGFKSLGDFSAPQTAAYSSAVVFSGKAADNGFNGPLESREYKSVCSLPLHQNRLTAMAYDVKGLVSLSGHQSQSKDSSKNAVKEIIVIDDAPETEDDGIVNDGMMKAGESSPHIPMSVHSGYDSRNVNIFHSYHPRGTSLSGGSVGSTVVNLNFQMPHPRGVNATTIKWNCVPQGSSTVHPSVLTASSSSARDLRSMLYYSSGFS